MKPAIKTSGIPWMVLLLMIMSYSLHGTEQPLKIPGILPISEARADRDTNFVPDRLGDTVTIAGRATVASDVLYQSRLQFALQDQTAGIIIYERDYTGPHITAGDSLVVTGVIGQYRGATQILHPQIVFADTINRTVPKPTVLKTVNLEENEGRLVSLTGFVMNKKRNRGGGYILIAPEEGSDSTLMVFVAENHKYPYLFDDISVGESVKITGILSQHDYRTPANGYYQLLPRSNHDVKLEMRFHRYALIIIGIIGFIAVVSLLFSFLLRKKVKQRTIQLLTSENRFQAMAQAAPVGIFRTRPDGYTTFVNPRWCELSGMKHEEALGDGWLQAVHPGDRETILQNWKDKTRRGQASSAEYRFVHAGGKVVWVKGRATPEYDNNHQIIGYIGSITDITNLKKAEEQLRRSEEEYRYLFENNPQPMWVYDLETLRFLAVNEAAVNNYGYSREEFLSMDLKDISLPEDIDALLKDVAQTTAGYNKAGEWKHRRKDGSIIDVEIISHKIIYQGKAARLVLANDITDRKKAEIALIESEKALNEAQIMAKMGNWEIDLITNKATWSDNNFRLFGLHPNEIEPTFEYFRNRIHPDDQKKIDEGFRIMNASKAPIEDELRIVFPGKIEKWILNKIIPVFENGQLVKLKGVNLDIDDLKKSTQLLRESEEKFRTLFEEHSAVMLLIDPETGQIVDANKAASSFYGWSCDKLKTMKISEINTLPRDVVFEKMQQAKSGANNYFEFRHRRADGSERDVEVYSSKVIVGKKDFLHSVIHDISEKKKIYDELIVAKEKAEESDRLKSAFLANMSHEIRTPMNGILGFTSLLLEPDLSDESKEEYIRLIHQSGERMLNTVNEIVEISKIESGTVVIHPSQVNISELVENIFNFFKPQAIKKGLDFKLINEIEEPGLQVETDRGKLESIVTNLVKNAIKFTEKGQIKVEVGIRNSTLEFCIRDTGIGIPKHRQAAVFNRFEQADIEDTRVFEGSGLGLAIAKSYVEMLGGKIWLESEVGAGSKFYFTIPLHKTRYMRSEPKKPEKQAVSSEHTILLVEDEPVNMQLLKVILGDKKYRLLEAVTGEDAVKLVETHPEINLVLMDVKLPGIDGWEATRRIKKLRPGLPVIAQTAYAFAQDARMAKQAGCDDYLAKPVKREELLKKLTTHLAEKVI